MANKKLPCKKITCKPLKGRKECQTCRVRKWRASNPFLASYNAIKSRALQRGITFELTKEEFKKFCDDTGYLDKKGKEADSMSIDRIKNGLGYVVGNIRILTLSENSKRRKKGLGGWNNTSSKEANDPF
jgi:hypothetical protein